MATKVEMEKFFRAAMENVARHGDTDIFPFPIENHVIKDKCDEIAPIMTEISSSFDQKFAEFPPSHINTLVPVGLTGFRQATQQDPFWNVFFLGTTLSLGDQIEAARISEGNKTVFSYRFEQNTDGRIFSDSITWHSFVLHSIELAKRHEYVVICDIADCYQRIYHHRLENALKQLPSNQPATNQIVEYLKNFSNTKSYGLPVGGPASRLLVELVLNMPDRLLKLNKVEFCRYADDYHIFVDGLDEAYKQLIFISEKLSTNDGLSLQKSKTRIMKSSEFIKSHSLIISPEDHANSNLQHLFSLKLRFDPYSATAEEDYERLKHELESIDILGILNLELAKTRIHSAVTKRLIAAIRHLEMSVMESAIITLLDNFDSLYPIFPVVAITLKSCFSSLTSATKDRICSEIRQKIIDENHLFGTDLHAAFAARILSAQNNPENQETLVTLHSRFRGPLVRRDVILAMARWEEFPWLSDQLNEYNNLSTWERRAFIIASYKMGDAGKNWRNHNKAKFNPFEKVVQQWASERVPQIRAGWEIPL